MQIDPVPSSSPAAVGRVHEAHRRPVGAEAPVEAPLNAPGDRMEASLLLEGAQDIPASEPLPPAQAPPVQPQPPDAMQMALREYGQGAVKPDVQLEPAAGGALLMLDEQGPEAPAEGVEEPRRGLGEKLKFWKWGIWERLQARLLGDGPESMGAGDESDLALSDADLGAYTARAAQDPLVQGLIDPTATVVKSKNLGSGVNASSKVTLSNGIEGVWKPTRGEEMCQLRDQCEEDHQGRREAATYIVDRWMNHFAGVPPVVYRSLNGEKGTLMLWVKDARVACDDEDRSQELLGDTSGESYQRLAVLDNVIGNLDRHDGNWMVDHNGQAVPIDHGLCFPLKNKRQGSINFDFDERVKLTPDATAGLRNLVEHRAEVTEELQQLIDPRAIDCMFKRVENMLRRGSTDDSWR